MTEEIEPVESQLYIKEIRLTAIQTISLVI